MEVIEILPPPSPEIVEAPSELDEPIEIVESPLYVEIIPPPVTYIEIDLDAQVEEIEIITGWVYGTVGGGAIAHTLKLLSGDNAGNAVDSGITPASVVVKNTAFPTPTNINQVIACLQSAGLCA
jgi:hypothetical protein